MNKMIYIAFALLICACGGSHRDLESYNSTFAHEQNRDYLMFLGCDLSIYDSVAIDKVATEVRQICIKMSPYKSLDSIRNELLALDNLLFEDYSREGYMEEIFLNRIMFHLQNPITFYHLPLSEKYDPLKIVQTPDRKYKFYTTKDISTGTMGYWVTHYQWVGTDGRVHCREWQDDRRFDCQGNVVGAWQFDYHDTTFYVLKGIFKGSSKEWYYYMEIVTFEEDGTPRYHIRFFPDMDEYSEIKKIDPITGEESGWMREGGDYPVAYTCSASQVDYTFDPNTLKVEGTTEAEGCGKVEKFEWYLKLDDDML